MNPNTGCPKEADESKKEVNDELEGGRETVTINTAGNEMDLGDRLPMSSLNKRQRELLEQLSKPGDTVLIPKKSVSMNDLRQLTSVTGDEFNMFTNGSRRLIIRGGRA